MTTPATQTPIWAHGRWARPRDPKATETEISWEISWPDDQQPGFDLDGLLDDYCGLAGAQPEEMADFIATYGVPELKGTEISDGSESNPMGFPVQSQQAGRVSVRELRFHARGVGAARRLGAALVTRRNGDRQDWADALNFLCPKPQSRGVIPVWTMDRENFDDWKLDREHFAELMTRFLADADVLTRADWLSNRRMSLEPDAGTLVGVVAILLAREIGADGEYVCDSCGAHVSRSRPPRKGERVYCDRPECKREQQRRNQAAWRARKAAESEE